MRISGICAFTGNRNDNGSLKNYSTTAIAFAPLEVIKIANGETIHLWSARDALVLKCLALYLPSFLSLSFRCTHIKGQGGLKATVANVQRHLPHYRFVMRTDVKGYYASIDHEILLDLLARQIKQRFLLNLLCQYLKRTVHWAGLYRDITRGISRGCPLSPLIGAFYLKILDEQLSRSGLYYVRYMDDILIMAPSRWKLRRAIKQLNHTFSQLKLTQHPDKTFIGRIEKGFDFLGYHFSRQPLTLASKTVSRFLAQLHRLYEQQQTAPEGAALLGDYVTRWLRWTQAGHGIPVSVLYQFH